MAFALGLGSLKALFSAGALLGSIHLLRRSQPLQRRSIRSAMRYQALQASKTPPITFPRELEINTIKQFLQSPPIGPLVVSGPQGVGTSAILTDALRLSGTELLLRVDLRQRAAGRQRTLLGHFVRSSGYYYKSRDMADIGMFQRQHSEIDEYEIDRWLSRLTDVLQESKVKRDAAERTAKWWQRKVGSSVNDMIKISESHPIPVLVLDNLQTSLIAQNTILDAIQSDGASMDDPEDEQKTDPSGVRALLRWAIFVTGAQLAHVVFVSRPGIAFSLDVLEPSFRSVRHRVCIDFLSEDIVEQFLISKSGGELEASEAYQLSHSIGGQLKDLRQITHEIESQKQHQLTEDWKTLHRQMMTDSQDILLSYWSRLVDLANNPLIERKSKISAFKRAERFWSLCNVLGKQGKARRLDLLASIFAAGDGVSSSELNDYVLSGLLSIHHDINGDILIAPASPRLRQAMIWMTTDDKCATYKAKADEQLLKFNLKHRISELKSRRDEQTNELRAIKTGIIDEEDGNDDVQAMVSALNKERKETSEELRMIREQYDVLKWKKKKDI